MIKKYFILGIFISMSTLIGQTTHDITLNAPSLNRGVPFMKAVSQRASVREFNEEEITLQDMSDLLWAANGINRPDEGKRTAPSAMNSQDVDIYVFLKAGVYLYDAEENLLKFVADGDHRNLIAGKQDFVLDAPLICLLVSDISRFKVGTDSLKLNWAAIDAGIVSQNINLFCASVGMATRPRASMDIDGIKALLKLSDTHYPVLNNPVSYKKD